MGFQRLAILLQSERKGDKDKGPKIWASAASNNDEGTSWSTWLIPAALAFAASLIYRMYFTKS